MIPGTLDTVAGLRAQGIKISSCSGYPKQVMDKVLALDASNGYVADHMVATDEGPNGRPWPAQALTNVIALGIEDVAACVKIDNTVPGILEGRRGGMWTVALTCSGNALGLPYAQFKALDADTLSAEHRWIEVLFADSRPHYLIDTIRDLPGVIADINQRLARGEMPQAS
ncbi:phosphonoacetaldehyde hydrolase [Pseudomonas mucidolens]|nr:phosphonoacetaldehyde hydrolase [Pseudomonas mucidolens]